MSYAERMARELRHYEETTEVHDLPPAFHYWSNRYVRPQLESLGFASPDDFLLRSAAKALERGGELLSIGSGNADLELRLARQLAQKGQRDFRIHCLEINPAMSERGRAAAQAEGLAEHLLFHAEDFNHWRAQRIAALPSSNWTGFDAVWANQSLHHVVELEHLLDEAAASLRPTGVFLVSDMIGRNGHQRWPTALKMVQEFWRELPPSYRWNRAFGVNEEWFQDRDCASHSFEGIRAQDILPLLSERFGFELFFAFGNVMDIFVDRTFGGHFQVEREWDRDFLDRVARRDQEAIEGGILPPTHLLARLRLDKAQYPLPTHVAGPSPAQCLAAMEREQQLPAATTTKDPYLWDAWPHDPRVELQQAAKGLARLARDRETFQLQAAHLATELQARTEWAQDMEQQRDTAMAYVQSLERDVAERTAWAQGLDRENLQLSAHIQRLE
ncbi:MAG: class I SAM-dependent methyltransferase [Bryobacter sp.]|nr:class I SAM-dependent methyltransferase [Bryobacter sp.]